MAKDIFEIVAANMPKGERIKITHYQHHINMIKNHVNTHFISKDEARGLGPTPRLKHSTFLKPNVIRKWDVIVGEIINMPHPHLVFKVTKDWVYAASTSSNGAKDHSLFEFKLSRFWAGKFLTNSVSRFTHEQAITNFIGVFDHKKEANEAIKALNLYYKNVFK